MKISARFFAARIAIGAVVWAMVACSNTSVSEVAQDARATDWAKNADAHLDLAGPGDDSARRQDAGPLEQEASLANEAIDCSVVGCAPPPVCGDEAVSCRPCGCCSCGDGQLRGENQPFICAGGCWTQDACRYIAGKRFWQQTLHPDCGQGPNGPVSCHLSIRFRRDGQFDWHAGGDIVLSGHYHCQGQLLFADGEQVGPFDFVSRTLTWHGKTYQEDDPR